MLDKPSILTFCCCCYGGSICIVASKVFLVIYFYLDNLQALASPKYLSSVLCNYCLQTTDKSLEKQGMCYEGQYFVYLNYSECSLKSYLKLIRWLFELFCILRIFNSSKCSLLKLPTSWKICDVKTLKASFFFPPVGELTFPHLFCLNVYQWYCTMFVQTRSSHLLQVVMNPVLNVWNTLWEMQMYLIEHFWGRTPKKWSCLYWTDHHPHLACGSEKVWLLVNAGNGRQHV